MSFGSLSCGSGSARVSPPIAATAVTARVLGRGSAAVWLEQTGTTTEQGLALDDGVENEVVGATAVDLGREDAMTGSKHVTSELDDVKKAGDFQASESRDGVPFKGSLTEFREERQGGVEGVSGRPCSLILCLLLFYLLRRYQYQ
ncbi:uncharacterized protein LOC130726653 [Lotus japonicus]|uniref:uncharacterized protein LOC130726653 n=1 Tax=Lotus japonicus TaxID=34305 RepID=UPI0025868BF0|nr:uncharacterized protein LOC130726653 [Lotus japonicus]